MIRFFLVLTVALLLAAPLARASVLLRFGLSDEELRIGTEAATAFRRSLQATEGNGVRVIVIGSRVWGRSGSSELELVRSVISGDPPLALVSSDVLANFAPALDVLEIPYIFRDEEHVERVLHGPTGRALLDGLSARGLVGMGFLGEEFRVFAATRAMDAPQDLAGDRVATVENSTGELFLNALGAEPVPAPRLRLADMARSGFVDAADVDMTWLADSGLGQQMPYVLDTSHAVSARVIIANQHFLDDLAPHQRISLWRAVVAAQAAAQEEVRRRSRELRTRLVERRQLSIASPAGTEVLRQSTRSLYKQVMSAMDPRILQEISQSRPHQ